MVVGSNAVKIPYETFPGVNPLIDGWRAANYGGPLAYGRWADPLTTAITSAGGPQPPVVTKDFNTDPKIEGATAEEHAREKERAAGAGWKGRDHWNEQVKTETKDYADKAAKDIVKSINSPLTWW